MMKQKIVAGNWKMNHSLSSAEELLHHLDRIVEESKKVNTFVFPPTLYALSAAKILNHKTVDWGVQNIHYEEFGAYTGEVNAEMVSSCNGTAVIIGHSERREHFSVTSSSCNLKIRAAHKCELVAFYCCGEPLEVRENNNHVEYVLQQLEEGLDGIDPNHNLVIAYEPVWAIGTGRTAENSQIEEMHSQISYFLQQKWGEMGKQIPVLYGGSCKPQNAKEIFNIPNVDGGLIGGASLKADDFIEIIKAANESS